MTIGDILIMLVSFVLGIVAAVFMFIRGIILRPQRSDADKVAEKLKARIEAAKAERAAAEALKVGEIKAAVEAEKKADPVDIANDIIRRS